MDQLGETARYARELAEWKGGPAKKATSSEAGPSGSSEAGPSLT